MINNYRYNGAGGAASSAASATPWGAIIGGGASIINGLVSNIFGAKAKQRELDLKEQEQKYRQALSTLDNQQRYLLQQKLDNAKTQTDRLRILEDSVSQIKIAQINAASKNTDKTAYLVLGSAALLIGLLIVVKKTDN